MIKLLAALALLATACAQRSTASEWPAGSKVNNICFEHAAADGGWELAQVRNADGRLPFKGAPVAGEWFFPMDAGALRLRGCW